LSTLTDLFSRSIRLWKSAVVVEQSDGWWTLLRAEEKLPLGDRTVLKQYQSSETLETILEREEVTRENVYYIMPPSMYYRNIIRFPFTDRQKIERIISMEVKDYLPSEEIDFLTDFYFNPEQYDGEKKVGKEVVAFTVEKNKVENILHSAGKFRENIKAIIPYDAALLCTINSVIERKKALIVVIQSNSIYLQYINNSLVRDGLFISMSNRARLQSILSSRIVMLLKAYDYPPVFINTRRGADSKLTEMVVSLFNYLNVQPRPLPIQHLEKEVGEGKAVEGGEMVVVLGALKLINGPVSSRVSLLKGEFKPQLRGYLRVRDFVILFSMLVFLLAISITNLFLDTGTKKTQKEQLRRGIAEVSQKAFGKQNVGLEEALVNVKELEKKVALLEKAIQRNYSSIAVFQEFVSFLPPNVVIEYTDLIIEPEHIKLAGKTKTFSDIDRIKESLERSEYFSDVKVSNTGTTGSTEGFMVSFVFDIDISFK